MANSIRYFLAASIVATLATVPAYSSPVKKVFGGVASFYADKFNGKKTASGELFDNSKLTCAHRTLPFGTKILVTNPDTGSCCEVTVTDRGPYAHNRVVDLSKAAAKKLGITGLGKVVCYAGKHAVDAVDEAVDVPGKVIVAAAKDSKRVIAKKDTARTIAKKDGGNLVAKKDSGNMIASAQTPSAADKAAANVPALADKNAPSDAPKVKAD